MNQDYISPSLEVQILNKIVDDLQEKLQKVDLLTQLLASTFLEAHKIQKKDKDSIKDDYVYMVSDFIYYILTQISKTTNKVLSDNLSQYSDQQLRNNLIHILRIEPANLQQQELRTMPDVKLKFKIFEMNQYKVKLHTIGNGSLENIYQGALTDSCYDLEDYWIAFKQFIINLNAMKTITPSKLCFCIVFETKQQYGINGAYGTGAQLRLSDAPCKTQHDKPFIELFNTIFLGKDKYPVLNQKYTDDQYLNQMKQNILWGTDHIRPYYNPKVDQTQKLQVKFLVYRYYFAEEVTLYIHKCKFELTIKEKLLTYYRIITKQTLLRLLESNLFNLEKVDKLTQRIKNLDNLLGTLLQDLEDQRSAVITFIEKQPNTLIKFRMLCLINSDALLYNKCLQTFKLYSEATQYKFGVTPTQIELVLQNPKYQPLITEMIKQQLDIIKK